MNHKNDDFLTIEEVAKMLRVNRDTIYRLIYKKKMNIAFKLGAVWRISRPALMEWIKENSQKAKPMIKHKKRRGK